VLALTCGIVTGFMDELRKLAAMLVAVVMLGLPAMACLVPDGQLTSDERECCKQMAGMCASGSMANSHPCCRTTVHPRNDATVTAAWSPARVTLVAVVVVSISAEFPIPGGSIAAFIAASPPESPLPSITVLRI